MYAKRGGDLTLFRENKENRKRKTKKEGQKDQKHALRQVGLLEESKEINIGRNQGKRHLRP